MNRGYVKLHRKTLESPVWQLPAPQLKVFIACLLRANREDRRWFDGTGEIVIPRGSFITSQPQLVELTRLGRQAVRGSLATLSKMGSIATKIATKRYTLISVVNWPTYQDSLAGATKIATKSATKRQPRGNHKQEVKKKEKSTEPGNGSAHQEILAYYHAHFLAKFESPPEIVGGRDGKIVQSLLRSRPSEEVKALLDLFFRVGTKYVRDTGRYDLPAFKTSINDLLVLRKGLG